MNYLSSSKTRIVLFLTLVIAALALTSQLTTAQSRGVATGAEKTAQRDITANDSEGEAPEAAEPVQLEADVVDQPDIPDDVKIDVPPPTHEDDGAEVDNSNGILAFDTFDWSVQNRLGIGMQNPAWPLQILTTTKARAAQIINKRTTGSANFGLWAKTIDAGSTVGYFWNSATSGTAYGVRTQVDSTSGYGIYADSQYLGVYGRGNSYGLYGYSPDYMGVYGSGDDYGIYGYASNASGEGVYGYAGSSSGSTSGVYGTAASTSGRGVYGSATASTGTTTGVFASSSSSSGRGIYASASSSTGTTYGVRGYAASSSGYAGYFSSPGTGVYASGTVADVQLGSTGELHATGSSSSDARIRSNDFVEIHLDENNDGEDHDFYIRNGADEVIFQVDDGGTTFVDVLQVNGADLAEQFDIAAVDGVQPKPGMVVSIDPANPGKLMLANESYDRKVVGVISGAGGVKAGMVLGQDGTLADGETPVAMTGRVYVWVDASADAVEPGDMLTTSEMPGVAMEAENFAKAQGSIIGKAMTGLDKGEQGLVLVLISLQ